MDIGLPIESLRHLYPYPEFEFESRVYARDGKSRSLYRVLVLFMLRPGTQDRILAYVCRSLFDRFPQPEDLINPDNTEAVLDNIMLAGLPKRKLKHIRSAAYYWIRNQRKYGTTQSICSNITNNQVELLRLKGVGDNLFELVMGYACGKPALPLDINVMRVVSRIRAKAGDEADDMDYVSMRKELKATFSHEEWIDTHEILRLHGMAVCRTVDPQCKNCPVPSCQSREAPFNGEMGVLEARKKAKTIITNEWGPWRQLICDSSQ